MKISSAVAERMSVLLKEKGLSKHSVEKEMAIPHRTMQNIIHAKREAGNLKTIFQICKGLGVSVSEFFNDPIFMGEELEID